MKLSIIIPIYNTWQWLPNILEKLSQQIPTGDRELEVILVDDGSEELRNDIIQPFFNKFGTENSTLRLSVSLENRGVSWARNEGLEKATGDIITFIDSDDDIEMNYVETVFENMETGCSYCIYDKYTTPTKQYYRGDRNALIPDPAVYCYSFTRECIGKEKFNEKLNVGEDIDWLQRVITSKENSRYTRDIIYWYCWHNNKDSLCKKFNSGKLPKERR